MSEHHGLDFKQSGLDFLAGLPIESGRDLLIKDIARRLDTDEGIFGQQLPEGYQWDKKFANYGYNLRRLVNAKIRDFTQIERRIEAECKKDERVSRASVSVTPSEGGASMTITIRITDADGPFPFTINVSELSTELLFEGREL